MRQNANQAIRLLNHDHLSETSQLFYPDGWYEYAFSLAKEARLFVYLLHRPNHRDTFYVA